MMKKVRDRRNQTQEKRLRKITNSKMSLNSESMTVKLGCLTKSVPSSPSTITSLGKLKKKLKTSSAAKSIISHSLTKLLLNS